MAKQHQTRKSGRWFQKMSKLIAAGIAVAIIAADFPQGRSLRGRFLPQIREDGGGQRNLFAPCSPGPCALAIWRAETKRD